MKKTPTSSDDAAGDIATNSHESTPVKKRLDKFMKFSKQFEENCEAKRES